MELRSYDAIAASYETTGKLSEDRGSFTKNLRRTPRERGSKEVAGTPADKEELWQRLENSGEDCEAPRKSGKLQRQ